jgi:small subunit ribosomal protein S27e
MKKEHIIKPEPRSKFQKVRCGECGEEQIVYSHASTQVTCNSCGNVIAKPTGAVAAIHGKISGTVE